MSDFLREIQAGIDAWPWYKKLYYQVWHWHLKQWINRVRYNVISLGQTFRYGYSYREVWNLETYASKWMLPRLKKLAEIKSGVPYGVIIEINPNHYELSYDDPKSKEDLDAAEALWNSHMADMVFFLEGNIDHHFYALPGTPEYKRYRRGKFLMFKYWESLWD